MHCGVPIVATDTGGVSDIVKDEETGLLVPPKDPAALAEGVIRLLSDEPLRRDLAHTARAFVDNEFTPDRMTEQTEMVYKENILTHLSD
jgi:glycosyltransferase involved in cell wall biosynthesis